MLRIKTIKFIDSLAFFFFGLLIFFLPISSAVIEISFGVLFICAIVKAFVFPINFRMIKDFFIKRPINLYLLIFFTAISCSFFSSGTYLSHSLRVWISKWGEGVFLFFLAQIFLNKAKIQKLMYVLAISSVLVSLDGVYQKMTNFDFLRGFPQTMTEQFSAVRASFNHYNNFASYLIVVFFVLSGFYLQQKTVVKKIIIGFFLLLTLTNLLFTYSRGAWLAFMVVSLISYFFLAKRAKDKCIFYIVLLIFIGSLTFIPFFRYRIIYCLRVSLDADRFKLWSVALQMFKDSPLFGQGLGLFMQKFTQYENVLLVQYSHNCYLQVLAETGLLGFLTFFLFLVSHLRNIFLEAYKSSDYLGKGLLAGFLAFLIHMFFDTQLFSVKLGIFFWLLSGFLFVYWVFPKNTNEGDILTITEAFQKKGKS